MEYYKDRIIEKSSAIKRTVVPFMEEKLGWQLPVLDKGFIRIIDYMGDDLSIEAAARMSYGKGTRTASETQGLLNYLMGHSHTTPFEMCLSGDTRVPHFSPDGVTVKTYSMKELADAFEQGGRENSWVKLLRIRTVNPDTGVVTSTKIKRAWKTGVRPVYEIVTKAPFVRRIKMTDNHRIMVPGGGFSTIASGLSVGSIIMLNGVPALARDVVTEIQSRRSKGQTIKHVAEALDVSESVVFKYAPGKAERERGFFKKLEGAHADPRAIARRVKELTICEAIGCEAVADHVHHVDENPHNNDVQNLMGLCAKHHKHAHHLSRLERTVGGEIESIAYVGEEDVYDLETLDPNHTFVAEGVVVHNCEIKLHVKLPVFVARQWIRHRTANVNEYSARYSILKDEFYIPAMEQITAQSTTNKQGRGEMLEGNVAFDVRKKMEAHANVSYGLYELLLRDDIDLTRELARINLPPNIYTEWYWKTDLHNLFHFLRLRADPHAQFEIREYAELMEWIVSGWLPMSWEAYRVYKKSSVVFSANEVLLVRAALAMPNGVSPDHKPKWADMLSKREWIAFTAKIAQIT